MFLDNRKIQLALLQQDMTQKELAKICGVSRQTINGIVCGRLAAGPRTAHKIAYALGMKFEDIML